MITQLYLFIANFKKIFIIITCLNSKRKISLPKNTKKKKKEKFFLQEKKIFKKKYNKCIYYLDLI